MARDIGEMARARRLGTTLEKEKSATDAMVASKEEADTGDNVSGPLDAVRAVLPLSMITAYTTGVVLLQSFATKRGADARAVEEAALATKFVDDPKGLDKALRALTVETNDWLPGRLGWAIFMLLIVAIYAFYKANEVPEGKKKLAEKVILEPLVTIGSFIAWTVAAPGTFVAAYLDVDELAVTSGLIGAAATILLLTLSGTVLSKKKSARGS